MAVTEVRLIEVDGGINDDGNRQYMLKYIVETDSINDGPLTAQNAAGVPVRFTPFSYGNDVDVYCVCKSKKARLMKKQVDYTLWEVTCTFDSKADDSDEEEPGEPLDRRTRWSGSYVQFTQEFHKDKDGSPILNGADMLLDPPIIGDDSRLSIVATKNFGSLNINTWASFRDAVNSSSWWGFDARVLKVQSITWEQRFHNLVPYYEVRFEFQIKEDTWDQKPANAGLIEKTTAGIDKRIADGFGRDMLGPSPLTVAGALIQPADRSTGTNYLGFRIYNEQDFANLGLPSSLGAA